MRPFVIAGPVLLCLVASVGANALPKSNTIEFSNCTLTMPGMVITTLARCGWLEVPEDPASPEGRKISLHVAMAPAVDRVAAPDPLFVFAGGPGQAASEAYVLMSSVLAGVRKRRDIVLVDQRGTGRSNRLQCEGDEEDEETFDASVDLDRVVELTKRCLESIDGDPRFYTTTIAMRDYDLVRRSMGYERINLLGVSYGTRAAQVYIRHYPEAVRSVILDGVVPMALHLGEEHAEMLDAAVAKVLESCLEDSGCAEKYPVDKRDLDDFMKELREHPRELTFIHPNSGKPVEITLEADTLAFAIRFLSYSSETQRLLPLLLHEAINEGDLERLTAQAMMVMRGMSEQISRGMELSVICSEDYPLPASTPDEGLILGDTMIEVLNAQCDIWPRGEVPDDFHDPVRGDMPTLLLSGDRDPVTPASYAAATAPYFPNHLSLVAKGWGHSVISNPCIREIAGQFVEDADTANLDLSCMSRIKAAPFFSSLIGPGP